MELGKSVVYQEANRGEIHSHCRMNLLYVYRAFGMMTFFSFNKLPLLSVSLLSLAVFKCVFHFPFKN